MRDIPVPTRPRDVVCADFDGDGFKDLAVPSKTGVATVLLHREKGEFRKSVYDTLVHNTSIAAADIDGDGDIDFVVLTEFRFGPIFLNDGKGKFTSYDPNIKVPSMSSYIQSADLNNNGLPDFAVISEAGLDVMLIYNRGNLHFETKELTVPLPDERKKSAEPGEEEDPEGRDGKGQKLKVEPEVSKKPAQEAGKPARRHGLTGIRHFAFTDLNGDGKIDMVFPITGGTKKLVTAINRGEGDFTFRFFDVPAEGPLTSVALLKRRNLELPVIAVSQTTPGKVFLFTNDGKGDLTLSGSFDTGENTLLRMTSADLDGDGNDDLIIMYGAPLPLDKRSPVQIWMQREDGVFSLKDQFRSNGYAAHVSFCEFSPSERAVVLSNMHEGTLSLEYIK